MTAQFAEAVLSVNSFLGQVEDLFRSKRTFASEDEIMSARDGAEITPA